MNASPADQSHQPPTRRRGALLVAGCLLLALTGGGIAAVQSVRASPDPKPIAGAPPPVEEGPDPGRLTTEMARRVDAAIAGAHNAGVELEVTSGWRSAAYQQALLDQAIERYGSREAATHWVLPPEDSAHVRGTAVDVGPEAGMAWLEENGAAYGLCRRYDNEPWHFEPLIDPGGTCPPREPYALATH